MIYYNNGQLGYVTILVACNVTIIVAYDMSQ